MATRIELPKDIVKAMLEQAQSLRSRQIKAATNTLIKEALEKEQEQIIAAKNTITEIK